MEEKSKKIKEDIETLQKIIDLKKEVKQTIELKEKIKNEHTKA